MAALVALAGARLSVGGAVSQCAYVHCDVAFAAVTGKLYCSRACKEKAKERRSGRGRHQRGIKGHPLYVTWAGMIQRCTNPAAANWAHYGGRGVAVCPRWRQRGGAGFRRFVQDMGDRPPGLTLDRIDPDGDYEPDNCRWATRSEQNLNKRKALSPHR